jgi:hypothetical protein
MSLWKPLIAVGLCLTVAGVVAGCWPSDPAFARSVRLVETPTWPRRGPRVLVDWPVALVRDAARDVVSIPGVLVGDGYLIRSGPEFITRERLQGARVLVIHGAVSDIADGRTRTLVTRWISEGGAVLMLTTGQPSNARQVVGAGRMASFTPSSVPAPELVAQLLATMHWLSDATTHEA